VIVSEGLEKPVEIRLKGWQALHHLVCTVSPTALSCLLVCEQTWEVLEVGKGGYLG